LFIIAAKDDKMAKEFASVSIIAANYNNGKYLRDFIGSVNESSILPLQLIIINDGSTDNSLEILDEFAHLKYLTVLKFQKNRGFCKALNVGIKEARGDYIMRVDPDDIVCMDRIKTQVHFLEKNKDIDVVGSNVIYFHSDTKQEVFRSNFPTDHDSINKRYLGGEHGIQHPSSMIRSAVMKKFKYLQENVRAEDYEIFARIIQGGHKFANIKQPLTRMRIHSQSVSNNIKYKTIKRTYKIRDKIFKTSTKPLRIWFYYWYILNYRKFLITQHLVMKPVYLSLAVMFYPSKFFRRIF